MNGLEIEIYSPCLDCKYPSFDVHTTLLRPDDSAMQVIRCDRACVCKRVLGLHQLDLGRCEPTVLADGDMSSAGFEAFVVPDARTSLSFKKCYNTTEVCVELVTTEEIVHIKDHFDPQAAHTAKLFLIND